MAGYQSITLVGNVGREVNFRYTQSGVPVADFSLAVTTRRGSGENRTEETLWVRVTCWRQLAEVANNYVKKGSSLLVVGTAKVSAYLDKAGQPAATLEVTADTFQLLGRRDDAGASGGTGGDARGGYEPAPDNLGDIPF